MKKTVVLYQSKYGSTKKYADWLSAELACDIYETKRVSTSDIYKYDIIILGGGIYAGGILGLSFVKKHYKKLKNKTIIVFAVGASPYNEDALKALKQRHFTGDLEELQVFYCRGAWNEDALLMKDRALCAMLKKVVAKKNPADYEPWEAALMQAIGNKFDWTEKKNLAPIIEAAYAIRGV